MTTKNRTIVTESLSDAGIICKCDSTGKGKVNSKFINCYNCLIICIKCFLLKKEFCVLVPKYEKDTKTVRQTISIFVDETHSYL